MQYNIRVIVTAKDRTDDLADAYFVFNAEWDNVTDAITDIAHHIDGTRPMGDAVERAVWPKMPSAW